MKFSLISLIALALTSTSVMAAAQPVAIEKRSDTVSGFMKKDYPKGQKHPDDSAPTNPAESYKENEDIHISCFQDLKTTRIWGDP
jgi:hypothetical protein